MHLLAAADNTFVWGHAAVSSVFNLPDTFAVFSGNFSVLSGNAGIGTDDPKAKLHITSSTGAGGATALRIEETTATPAIWEIRAHDTSANVETNSLAIWNAQNNTKLMHIAPNGNVGIGILTTATARLYVGGSVKVNIAPPAFSGTKQRVQWSGLSSYELGYDIAELFETSEEVAIGDVLVSDKAHPGKLRKNDSAYDKKVTGIVSWSPAISFKGSHLMIGETPGTFTKGTNPPVALLGRVACKVSIENGPIEPGDLLTTSSTKGHAMKATDLEKSPGAIVGKALEPFSGGPDGQKTGMISVLVAGM